jgi:hypothetical protein
MPIDFSFRRQAVRALTPRIGVYVLADLDNVPVYVGQSRDGVRQRVQRHLTSARSDVIANRQIDVWEIAFVWAYPLDDRGAIGPLEAALFHHFHPRSRLMNGTAPPTPPAGFAIPEPAAVVQVMSDREIAEKKDPELRLPRQAQHYAQLVGHFVAVKNSRQVAGAMDAHFERLAKYHAAMLGLSAEDE